MLTQRQQLLKRLFDVFFSIVGLLVFTVPIFILVLLATVSTKQFGLFMQQRIGQFGKIFYIYKIRTMYAHNSKENYITLKNDQRITRLGLFLRKTKLDELPQLFNVFIGDMSFVGPRPDVVGYADQLKGNDQILLKIKPGITAPSTLKYKNEDALLADKENPKNYNDTVIWKDKVRLNIEYIENWTFSGDVKCILHTIFY